MNDTESRTNINKRRRVYQTNDGNNNKVNIMKRLAKLRDNKRKVKKLKAADTDISSDEFDSMSDDRNSKCTPGYSLADLNCPLLQDEGKSRKKKSSDIIEQGPEIEEVQLQQKLHDDVIEATSQQSSLLKKLSTEEHLDHIWTGDFEKRIPTNAKTELTADEVEETKAYFMKKYQLPNVLYFDELLAKVKPKFNIVDKILKGKMASPYYIEAKHLHKNSKKALLSTDEFRHMDMTKFQAGFYGLKRQLRLGQEIYNKFRVMLLSNKSPTLKWWGALDFAQFVLAPELLLHLCIEEMNLQKKAETTEEGHSDEELDARELAYDLFKSTIVFGTSVADAYPLEEWESHIRT
ncbi:hypothetical protein TPHA_0B04260 [Tetrapisispora phaffii CBS 4417]|uniref:Restriction of telomere capping protein 4 n=1 Tax=Tetrapisispora phaffii (strain ATCC 24235 / CBS 4417 / NBRC 1672 / NRRL Y-8282 / UCD 70-5) TaxID=1071381 RepID=G8BQ14_TETPH|nr:hypothetical protein TPHA_0B04260 [Tetrapisispora phaffii CBS 4417]CCE62095.1 hypothetical protein TPHA_0B04260 [Tetrapisispora phaffii CBS 4417]